MDETPWIEAVLRNRERLNPIPTEIPAALNELPAIRAVLFDVYGTLVVSGSGDVGTASEDSEGDALADAYRAVGWGDVKNLPTVQQLHQTIRSANAMSGHASTKPEVDIVEIWRTALRESGNSKRASQTASVVRLAAEYESRANPTWPMPGATELLRALHRQGIPMGVVSNAQAFTTILVRDLTGTSLELSGFDLDLCILSYRFREAKPSPLLFEQAVAGLDRRGIAPASALYVGNDMLNDVWAASQAGLRTAWFTGDARSCRERRDEARCRSLRPDVVLSELNQVLECVGAGRMSNKFSKED